MSVRFRELVGVNLATDRLSILSYGSAANSGTFFTRNPDVASGQELYISSNEADYLLEKDITTTGPSLANKVLGVVSAEIKIEDPAPVFLLREGAELILEYYESTGTGVVSAATGVGTDLSVNDSGRVCVKQSSGIGSVKRFELIENLIGGAGGIRIRKQDT